MVLLSQVEVCCRSVLRPLVTVECKSTSDLFLLKSISDRIRDQRRRHIRADLPCQDGLGAQVQYGAHVQHASGNGNIGDICHPELIWLCLIETAIEQIRIPVNGLLVACIGFAATNDRQQTQLSYDAQNGLRVHCFSRLTLDPASDTTYSVGLFALLLTLHDQISQPRILCLPALPFSPRSPLRDTPNT